MIAFDTNYLVRHLVQDDPEQCRVVAQALKEARDESRAVLLTDLVLCETVWVLRRSYGATREDVLTALQSLLDEPLFQFVNADRLHSSVASYAEGSADFADYLILWEARKAGAELRTFDKVLGAEA